MGHQHVLQHTKAYLAMSIAECPTCPLWGPMMDLDIGTISQQGKMATWCQVVKSTNLDLFHILNASFSSCPQVFIPRALINKHLTCWSPARHLHPKEPNLWQVSTQCQGLCWVTYICHLHYSSQHPVRCFEWWLPLRVWAGSLRG